MGCKVQISEIAKVKGGKRLPKGVHLQSKQNAHPYIRVRDFNCRTLELNDAFEYVDDETQKSIRQYIVSTGDVLVTIVGTIGLTAIVGQSLDGANLTENCVKISGLDSVDSEYLYYYLSSPFGQQEIARRTVGAVQPKLPIKNIRSMEIDYPTREERERIVALLSLMDDKVEFNSRINDYLAAITDSGFDALIATETEEVPLPQVIDILSGGTPKTKEYSYWEGGTIPFFGPGDVGSSAYVLTTEKHITELGLQNCNSSLYPIDTVFLTARGTVGKVAVAGRPMAMNQSCFALTGNDWIPQTYVFQIIKRAVKSLRAKANGATFAAINTRDLRDELIPIPSRKTIENYDNWARPLFSLMLANEEESLRLASLRDALLPKLMTGEIDVSKIELPTQPNNHFQEDE